MSATVANFSSTLALLLAPIAAQAQVAPAPRPGDSVFDDLKCFVLAGNPPQDATPDERQSFALVAVFFTGKLYGRDPEFSIAAAAATYKARLETMDFEAEFQRCVAEFDSVGAKLSAFGNS